jgi:hypothetical protein
LVLGFGLSADRNFGIGIKTKTENPIRAKLLRGGGNLPGVPYFSFDF